MDEKNARYRVTHEPSAYSGGLMYYVYEKCTRFNGGFLGLSEVEDWKFADCFRTLEEAEKYIEEKIAYRNAKENPKVIGYY